jgi:hypothetical protein
LFAYAEKKSQHFKINEILFLGEPKKSSFVCIYFIFRPLKIRISTKIIISGEFSMNLETNIINWQKCPTNVRKSPNCLNLMEKEMKVGHGSELGSIKFVPF